MGPSSVQEASTEFAEGRALGILGEGEIYVTRFPIILNPMEKRRAQLL